MHQFDTPGPVRLVVEIGAGSVRIDTADTARTTIELDGPGARDTTVTEGEAIRVIGPTGSSFFRDTSVHVRVRLPLDSAVAARTGSGDITAAGRFGTAEFRTGSGDVSAEAVTGGRIQTGSGDVRLEHALGPVALKCGSGDVQVHACDGDLLVATGSGDIELRHCRGPVAAKTGSGRLVIDEAESDVAFSAGSGELELRRTHRGKVTIKGASTDCRIGIARDTPVWTDISTISGRATSDLDPLGEPAEGQEYVEVRITTVSGDIHLSHV